MTVIGGRVRPPDVRVVELAWIFQPVTAWPRRCSATWLVIANVFVWSSPLSVTAGAVTGLEVLTEKLNVAASPAGATMRARSSGANSLRIVYGPDAIATVSVLV